MNNTPVPMDLDRARAPTWCSGGFRGFRGGFQGHVAQTNRPPLTCFNCRKEGHFARNCFQRRQTNANLIDFQDNISETTLVPDERDCITQLCSEIDSMTIEDRMKLVQEMGVAEDFPSAWSDWHWLGKATVMMYTYLLGNLWQSDSSYIRSQKELKPLPW